MLIRRLPTFFSRAKKIRNLAKRHTGHLNLGRKIKRPSCLIATGVFRPTRICSYLLGIRIIDVGVVHVACRPFYYCELELLFIGQVAQQNRTCPPLANFHAFQISYHIDELELPLGKLFSGWKISTTIYSSELSSQGVTELFRTDLLNYESFGMHNIYINYERFILAVV